MHKITKNVMAAEEPLFPTACGTEPERWFPDEQKPDPYAVAACWSCHFQAGCARRALAQDEEFGVWGGYRLAPGPSLERRREQLQIIAGYEMGPAMSPGAEITSALTVLEDIKRGVADLADLAEATDELQSILAASTSTADAVYRETDDGVEPVALDDWREPTAAEWITAEADERSAMEHPVSAEEITDAFGQILLPLDGWGSGQLPTPSRRRARTVSARCGASAGAKRAS